MTSSTTLVTTTVTTSIYAWHATFVHPEHGAGGFPLLRRASDGIELGEVEVHTLDATIRAWAENQQRSDTYVLVLVETTTTRIGPRGKLPEKTTAEGTAARGLYCFSMLYRSWVAGQYVWPCPWIEGFSRTQKFGVA